MRVKDIGVNIMVASSMGMETAVSVANEIGIIKEDESSILINGNDFVHIVGGVICDKCKKSICQCIIDRNYQIKNHKVKNIDEFERILKHLDVMANAEAIHKYTLVLGLKNKNICTAVTGKIMMDIPSMLHSYISLY